jgi:hypothetical protein
MYNIENNEDIQKYRKSTNFIIVKYDCIQDV